MPAANISASNMSQLVRDTYQANGLVRSHAGQSAIAASQTSLQKLPASSPQFHYQQLNNSQQQQQQQQSMQFPPAPLQQASNSNSLSNNHSLIPQNIVQLQQQQQSTKNELSSSGAPTHQYNPMMVPQQQQQQQQQLNQNLALSIMSMNGGHMPSMSGTNAANSAGAASQPAILAAPMLSATAKGAHLQQHQQQQQLLAGQYQQHPALQQAHSQQQPTYMTQQQILAAGQQQQQVPMTTIMIPAATASQLQGVSVQIQQAAMQAAPHLHQSPQILVLMIPYPAGGQLQAPPSIPMTPEQPSLNSTLVRQSHSNSSIMRHSQQQQPQSQAVNAQPQPQQQQQTTTGLQQSHSRAVSSLSNGNNKQEPEKFYAKANFSYRATRNRQELSFQKGDILHVLDTLQNNDYGVQYWLATRVNQSGEDAEKGLIPNKDKAEQIAIEQRTMDIGEQASNGDGSSNSNNNNNNNNNNSSSNSNNNNNSGGGGNLSASIGRVNFLKRRSAQRSKSLCKDNWDNAVFDIGTFRLPTYERVVFKHPGFCRPVVIFGPISDLAREKLLKDYPEKYSYPTGISQSPDHPKVIRLKGVLDVIDQGKHALLDITAQAVEKLNYVNLAPIVIFMKSESKSIIKEFRSRAAESLDPSARDEDTLRRDAKSSRKLLEQSIKLEKQWFHVFTAVLDLSTMGSEMWYRKLREIIENQQSANVWMGEKREKRQQMAAAAAAAAAAASVGSSSSNVQSSASNNNNLESVYPSGQSNGRNSLNESLHATNSKHAHQQQAATQQQQQQQQQHLQLSTGCLAAGDNSSALSDRFSACLNLTTTKSTNDLLPVQDGGIYGNRSKLRNDYVHSLAQKLARASSEPKLNGPPSDNENEDEIEDCNTERHNGADGQLRRELLASPRHHQIQGLVRHADGNDDDDDDDDYDDDEIIKKPLFPNEYDNSSSVSSSNGMGSNSGGAPMSFGQFSLGGGGGGGGTTSSLSAAHLQNAPYQHQQHQQQHHHPNSTGYQMQPLPLPQLPSGHHHHHQLQPQQQQQQQIKPAAPLPPQAQAQALQTGLGQQSEQQQHLNQLLNHHHQLTSSRSLIATEGIYSMGGPDSMPLVKAFSAKGGRMLAQHSRSDYQPLPPVAADTDYHHHSHQPLPHPHQHQHQHHQQQQQQQQQQQLQSLTGSTNTNGSSAPNSSSGAAAPPPPPPSAGALNGHSKNSTNNSNNAFHIYSDMNQNNYHYYNVNKI